MVDVVDNAKDVAEKVGFYIGELFTDQNMEEDGVWINFHGNTRLRIASYDSPKYKAELTRLAKRNKLILDDVTEDDASRKGMERIVQEATAKHILLDWEGIEVKEQGTADPYTAQLGMLVLRNSSKFRKFVEKEADDYTNFQRTAEEEEAAALEKK